MAGECTSLIDNKFGKIHDARFAPGVILLSNTYPVELYEQKNTRCSFLLTSSKQATN